jgi:allophanate hydrolase
MTGAAHLADALGRIAAGNSAIWISRCTDEAITAEATAAPDGPLSGTLFAVKDNIDVAGMSTTAGCPAFAYSPDHSAPAVDHLRAAGATLVGKTNLDQFATGLVGTRSPYGSLESVLAPGIISGGSSSGSAVAVAAGLVDIALGTDTAGSGRVPAALNGIVGLKPTRGLVSTVGVVPACRSLDCVSVFARSCAEAELALASMLGPDGRRGEAAPVLAAPRVGVPTSGQLEWFGDLEAATLFDAAVTRLKALGAQIVEVDLDPFLAAGRLLYGGPWVAERTAVIGEFVAAHADDVHPVVREVVLAGADRTAVDAYQGAYRLEELVEETTGTWEQIDVLALPTTAIAPTVAETLADPHRVHARLGTYTTFVNLMDLCAISIPAGIRPTNGAPFGLQLVAPAFSDTLLSGLGTRFEATAPQATVALAVVGAHLSGQPLNHQLTRRGARLLAATRTAPNYRLHHLADTVPPKPGLVRTDGNDGVAIDVEVWELTTAAFGAFTAEVPAPLGIGSVTLDDGTTVKGFICEPAGLTGARDISEFGGWRAYRAHSSGA